MSQHVFDPAPVGSGAPPSADGAGPAPLAGDDASKLLPVLLVTVLQAVLAGALTGFVGVWATSFFLLGPDFAQSVTDDFVGGSLYVSVYAVVIGGLAGLVVGLGVGGLIRYQPITDDDPKARHKVAGLTLLFTLLAVAGVVTPATFGMGLFLAPLALVVAPAVAAWRAPSLTDRRRFDRDAPGGLVLADRYGLGVAGLFVAAFALVYAAVVAFVAVTVVDVPVGRLDPDGPLGTLRQVTLPGSLGFDHRVVVTTEIGTMGAWLGAIGIAQAVIVLAGAAWMLTGRRLLPAIVVAAMVVVIVVANLAGQPDELVLPDRGDPAVQAEEARIAAVVAESRLLFAAPTTTCRALLLKQRPETGAVWATVECTDGTSARDGAVRVRGGEVELFPEKVLFDNHVPYFPDDVVRAVVLRGDELRP